MVKRLLTQLALVSLVGSFCVFIAPPIPVSAAQDGQQHQVEALRAEVETAGIVMASVSFTSTDAMHQVLNELGAERGLAAAPEPMAGPGLDVVAVLDSVAAAEMIVTDSAALDALASNPDVTSIVVPPAFGSLAQGRSDELRGAQRRTAIEANLMHDLGYIGQGISIALVDTGVDGLHPDLQNAVVFEQCIQVFSSTSCDNGASTQAGTGSAIDVHGHGTDMASLMVSDGASSVQGMAPSASLEAFRISDRLSLDLRDALLSLDMILEERPDVDIVVLSLASNAVFDSVCDRDLWPAFFDTVGALRARGVFVTASAGNGGHTGSQAFPACLADVHAVTGLSVEGGALAATANIASSTSVAAPGSGLVVHDRQNLGNGTSDANALAAGCAALAMQSGRSSFVAIAEWLAGPVDRVGRGALSVPVMQCAPYCLGQAITVNLAAGDEPTDGHDVIAGTSGADYISGGLGDDLVCSFGGHDVVLGGQGNDRIEGGVGNDRLFGNFGSDALFGGPGADTLHGSAGDDELFGQPGDDRLYGYAGDDRVSGGQGNDRLHGNAGNDELAGDSGDDRIFGYANDDVIDGGIGADVCAGNTGTDSVSRCEVVWP